MPYVTDTHALIWYMSNDPKLSENAKEIFVKIDDSEDYIVIPCIVFFELLYLIEKKKIDFDFDKFIEFISSSKNYKVEPLCIPIIRKSREIPREKVNDPWDRLISATALHLNIPLITKDSVIRKIGIEVIW